MEQSLLQTDSLPAINITSPGPSERTSSPATLEAGNDSLLTPVSPLPKISQSQSQVFTNQTMPQRVPSPRYPIPTYNAPFRFSEKGMNVFETPRDFSRRDARHAPCHVHLRNSQIKKDNGKKVNGEAKDDARSRRPREPTPCFSSPWASTSCSPRRVVWKEVEDYNRQRKRVRFVGWAGIENPWETECSSTAWSEGSDCSDDIESPGPVKCANIPSENQQTRIAEKGNGDEKCEPQSHDSVKVMITTSKDGATTTVLETGRNAKRGDGVEIVTKTLVRGDEVAIVTTTTLIPLTRTESGG